MWDGYKLFVASHGVGVSTDTSAPVSVPGGPRGSTRTATFPPSKTWSPRTGSGAINKSPSESLTLAKDSTGTIVSHWTQVQPDETNGYTIRCRE